MCRNISALSALQGLNSNNKYFYSQSVNWKAVVGYCCPMAYTAMVTLIEYLVFNANLEDEELYGSKEPAYYYTIQLWNLSVSLFTTLKHRSLPVFYHF
jgi:hypothetical protein